MKPETKLLTYTLGGFCAICVISGVLEKVMKWDMPFNPLYAHVEVHADRPLPEVVREQERDRETADQREAREIEESQDRSLDTDWGGRWSCWYDAEKIYPPASGKVLIYAVNGRFKSWKYVY